MTLTEQIKQIFSNDYHPRCQPSKEEEVKIRQAISLIAQYVDTLEAIQNCRTDRPLIN